MLLRRKLKSTSFRVFTGPNGLPLRVSSLDHEHEKLRDDLKLPEEFVLHSLRHTYGTRLGDAGVDAYTIMKLMGFGGFSEVCASDTGSSGAGGRAARCLQSARRREGLSKRTRYSFRNNGKGDSRK